VIAILHTWGQNLLLHPHIHCVIPAGGLSPDHRRWVGPRYPFFLPVKVLSRVFRGKFLAGLKRLYRSKKLQCAGLSAPLADPRQFAKLLRRLHRHDWVVYAKPAFGGPMQVLRYLGRYTHRVAISNARLVSLDQGRVRFRYKDYADGSLWKVMQLSAEEFLRRFLLHVLPKRFVRIRHYGLLAGRNVPTQLARCRELLTNSTATPAPQHNDVVESVLPATEAQTAPLLCPHCRHPLTRQLFEPGPVAISSGTNPALPVAHFNSS
jgi:hypothetical protein